MKVIKRDGHMVDWCPEKVENAIMKANSEVEEEDQASSTQIKNIIKHIEKLGKKRILVDRRNAERNKAIKSSVKTAIKKVDAAIAAKDKTAADSALVAAISEIDKAASKGVYHKKTASRKISRLTLAVNKIA